MNRPRPGAAARKLLGGDESLHVFAHQDDATEYLRRVPGSRVYAPRQHGWACVLHDAITGAVRVRDTRVSLEWDHRRDKRSGEIVLEVAAALYDKGAVTVRVHGAVVRMPERTQTWRGAK